MGTLQRVIVFAAIIAGTSSAQGARFVPLGWLPGGNVNEAFSTALDVSADGTVVVGSSRYLDDGDFRDTAFRWTEAEGMTLLGVGFEGAYPEEASAISGDGLTIAGSYAGGQFGNSNPFKWTDATGIDSISPRHTRPSGVSYDGSAIVGIAVEHAYDISWDGSVVVGSEHAEAFVEISGSRIWLGDLPGGDFSSIARAVSGDGTVVVGQSATLLDVNGEPKQTGYAFVWTEAIGMTPLTDWASSTANDISATKLVIVGGGTPQYSGPQRMFRWTPARGMESVSDLLLAEGINLQAMGWNELTVNRVSADGRVIVGTASKTGGPVPYSEAFLIELDVPGDFDQDGDSDGADFLAWQQGYGTSYDATDLADWNANLDYLRWLTGQAPALNAVPELPASSLALSAILALAMIVCDSARIGQNRH